MNDRKAERALDLIHAKIHGLRMLDKYVPSKFEREVNVSISEVYEDECTECRRKLKEIELKKQLDELNPPKEEQKSFFKDFISR